MKYTSDIFYSGNDPFAKEWNEDRTFPAEMEESWEKYPKSKRFHWNTELLKDPEYREALKKEWKEVFGSDKELYFAKKSSYGGMGKISVISMEKGIYNSNEGQVISFVDLEECE